jgi:hypothetical protein
MSEWITFEQTFRNPNPKLVFTGNKQFDVEIAGSNHHKIITIVSVKQILFMCPSYEDNIKYSIKYTEQYFNDNGLYDVVAYEFELIWNTIINTYWLNDIKNGKYETNIIGNVNSDESTKEQNTCFLKGETFINYVFSEPITYKNIIDDCF